MYETKLQYEHLVGQNGIDMYSEQAFLGAFLIIFDSALATDTTKDALG